MRGAARPVGGWKRLVAAAVVVPAAVVALGGCSKGKERRVIEVVKDSSGRAGYSPEATRVHKGARVGLVVVNTTDKVHGLEIIGYNLPPLEIGADAPNNLPFTANKAGTFEIRCQLHEAHRPGVLIVE